MINYCKFPVVIGLATLLASCVSSQQGSTDDKLSGLLVAPGKFVLYTCPEIAEKAAATAKRQRELEALMAKAGTSGAGGLVSAVAYRPEYLETRGDMNELRRAAAEKGCKFVPGVDQPGARASDKLVR